MTEKTFEFLCMGVDPGASSGYAIVGVDGDNKISLITAGTLKEPTGDKITPLLVTHCGAYDETPLYLAIEDQFLHKTSKNFDTAKKIARCSGVWLGAIQAAWKTINARFVYPQSWQTAMLKVAGRALKNRDEICAMYKKLAEVLTGKKFGPDASAAICIAWYLASEILLERRTEQWKQQTK